MAELRGIRIYPVKALDGLDLDEVRVDAAGALEGDRRYAILEADGSAVNGKRVAAVHAWRARFSPGARSVRLAAGGEAATEFDLPGDLPRFAAWASERLGRPVRVEARDAGGFPDDREAWGPTILSTASLDRVAAWFPDLSLEDLRRRFRANLELSGLEPFGEDRLAGRTFRLGSVRIEGSNPCHRCVVPSRDPDGGGETPGFQRRFVERRAAELPEGVDRARYENPYRLALNTRIPPAEAGRVLRRGDLLAP